MVLVLLLHNKRVLEYFCKAFVYSPYVCVGFFWVLQLPSQAKDMHVWLINDSKLAIYRMYFSLQQNDDM